MPDLPIAMSLDNTLLQMVKDTVSESDLTKLEGEFEKIIFRWAGVKNVSDKDIGVSWAILNGDDKVNRLLHSSYDFFTDSISLDNKFDLNAYNAQIEKMFGSQDINQINLALISVMTLKEKPIDTILESA